MEVSMLKVLIIAQRLKTGHFLVPLFLNYKGNRYYKIILMIISVVSAKKMYGRISHFFIKICWANLICWANFNFDILYLANYQDFKYGWVDKMRKSHTSSTTHNSGNTVIRAGVPADTPRRISDSDASRVKQGFI